MSTLMHRREFIALGAAAASPLVSPYAAHAQQRPSPVIGISSRPIRHPAFIQALRENGFVEGQNVEFDFRWGSVDELADVMGEFVRHRVAAIYAGGLPGALAAKAATTTIPIVFAMGEDPVKEGVVASLNRPGGNITGYVAFSNQLVGKRLDLLHELAPKATVVGLLANDANPNFRPDTIEVQAAATTLGLRVQVFTASNERELGAAFDAMARAGIAALLVGVDPWFRSQAERVTALANRHGIIANYELRLFAEAGGLMSYGTDFNERARQSGLYFARILKGAKPEDLPVQQATRFEFILNLKTAKALGVEVPTSILLRANEVIE